MKSFFFTIVFICISIPTWVYGTQVKVQKSEDGFKLLVDGKDFLIKGMNWEYYPIGTNYTYSLWEQPEAFIKEVLEKEMTLLKDMGVNALRIYLDMPKKWITYIYENYGIYTMLNHTFGRYGLMIDNEWMANTEYDNPKVKELLLRETTQLAREYKNTPGLLFFLLGNENNYHVFWENTEKDKAVRKKENTSLENRGMYKIFLLSKEKKNVKYIRCNNARENYKLQQVLDNVDMGIKFEFTAVDTPQQNGKMERKFATLYGRVRSAFNNARLKPFLRFGL